MDVEQLIRDLEQLNLNPAKLAPLVARLRAEGLTDELRLAVNELLDEAEQESTAAAAIADGAKNVLGETQEELMNIQQQADSSMRQLTSDFAALEQQAQAVQNTTTPANPLTPQPVIATPPPLSGPVLVPATPTMPLPPVVPAQDPVSIPTPLPVSPAPASVPSQAAPVPADDTADWLSLLQDVNDIPASAPAGDMPAPTNSIPNPAPVAAPIAPSIPPASPVLQPNPTPQPVPVPVPPTPTASAPPTTTTPPAA